MAINLIFDLDGTLIDSSHRQQYDANGVLDLQAWRYNNKPEKILADKLTPLGLEIVDQINSFADAEESAKIKESMLLLTARDMNIYDHELLKKLGLSGIRVLSRASCTELEKRKDDSFLKPWLLKSRNVELETNGFWFYDDMQENLDAMKQAFPNCHGIHAGVYNQ